MSTIIPQQLLLGVKLDSDATFENFYVGDSNKQLLQSLHSLIPEKTGKVLFIWSGQASGKTHLQQAVCHRATANEKSSIYIPLKNHREMDPSILIGLEQIEMVCLDDVDVIAGIDAWEEAIFNLYNRVIDAGSTMLFSGSTPPNQLPLLLPDLYSRLQSVLVYRLHSLTDPDKAFMLKLRAEQMGIILSDAVIEFILLRSNRDVPALLAILGTLDQRSLEQKRPVTIPLVKQALGW